MSLYVELKRRNVFRVAILYIVAAWVVLQIADVAISLLSLPDWSGRMVFLLIALGFIPALVISWVYELTPEGLKREHAVAEHERITHETGSKINTLIGVFGAIAILTIFVDRLIPETATQMTTPVVTAAAARSIAVLPFVNMTSDPEQEYFSDGISEELLDMLAKVADLRVISRTSSFQFKGENMDVREIAAKLGVATILEGSVRKAGNKVRVTAQLIDARNGVHLWSETYNRDLNDIFAVQGDIAGAVVQALKIELLGQVPLATTLNPSSEAHALYLQARYLVHRRTEENAAKAVTLLQPALELESNYAPAWALLAEVHLDQGKYGYAPMASSIADAHKAARRAIELDPKLTQPRLVLIELALSEWDVATANAEMERVLALDPGNADALRIAGNLATTRGDTKTGIALLRQSLARDPLRFPTYNGLGLSQLYAGQLVEAEATFRERLELDPDGASSYSSYAFVLLTKGDPQAALEMAKREPDEALRLTAAALSLHALDRSTESDVLLNQLITGHAEEMAYQISEVYAYRGEVDNAFTWLGRAYDQQDGGLQEILGDPTLANLRNDPRYTALVRKLNLGD